MRKVWILKEDSGDGWFPDIIRGVYANPTAALADRDTLDPGPFDDDDDELDVRRRFYVVEADVHSEPQVTR